MCAFVRRNCPARRDHCETVAKPPCATRGIVHPETRCVSRCHPSGVIWAEDLLGGVMGPAVP
eukprot:3693757-Prymnesium_polylepis.1